MKTYTSPVSVSPTPCVVALGCFDGVHVGHAAVIREAVQQARSLSLPCAVWTFSEPPRNVLQPNSAPPITDGTEKKNRIRALGADLLFSIPFTDKIGSMSPEQFFEEILCQKLHAAHVVCGYNYSFGKGGQGNADLLAQLCASHGIGMTRMPEVTLEGVTVSSSAIRQAVQQGEMARAAALLGRPFSLRAPVVNGQHLARRLGFPTLNQVLDQNALCPRHGVYVSRVRIGTKTYRGISNVGVRPTVGTKPLCCETHLFDFSGNLYGRTLRVELLHFLRPEQPFTSVEALAEQVRHDITEAHAYFAQN